MSQPGRAKNYFESSGGAMFIYSILKGVRVGYISGDEYSSAMKNAYDYITANLVKEGDTGLADYENTVSVGSLSGAGDYNVSVYLHRLLICRLYLIKLTKYYVSQTVDTNDLKGIAAFVLASVEMENAGLI